MPPPPNLHRNTIPEPLQRGDRLLTTESDVCRRQILTFKVNPRAERTKIFTMAVEPQHSYSNET